MTCVTSYTNPDADGICSAIAYTFLMPNVIPLYSGVMDSETAFILQYFNVAAPIQATNFEKWDKIVLVDTHNINEISKFIDVEKVAIIIDHHLTGGTRQIFSNVTDKNFQNEAVGAACTLIAEKMKDENLILSPSIAGIMALAIISNTLNFNAQSTSQRDISIYEWLKQFVKIDDSLILEMFTAKSNFKYKKTYNLLSNNLKIFDFGNIMVGMIQIEMIEPKHITQRKSFKRILADIKEEKALDYLYFSGVNINVLEKFTTLIYCLDSESQAIMSHIFGNKSKKNTFLREGILLRKTHLIPLLVEYFKDNHKSGKQQLSNTLS